MEKYLRKNSVEEVRSKWRRYAASTISNHPERRFHMVVTLAAMRSKTECQNRKVLVRTTSRLEPSVEWPVCNTLQVVNTQSHSYPHSKISTDEVVSDEIVAARKQTDGAGSPCEPHLAPISVLSPVTSLSGSEADSWGWRSFVCQTANAFVISRSMILSLWTRSENNDRETSSEIHRGKEIEMDIHNHVSIPTVYPSTNQTPQVLDRSSYMGDLSSKQTNYEGMENAAVIARGKHVVLDIPCSSSILAPSLDLSSQERNSSSSSSESSRNHLDKTSISMFPGKETTIEMPTSVSPLGRYICNRSLQILEKSSSSVGLSQILADEVDFNVEVAARDQTNGETNSSHIEHPNNFLSEAQQAAPGIATDDSGTTSQPADQPTPVAVVGETEDRVPGFKTAAMIVCTVITISGAGIVSIIPGRGEKKTGPTHEVLLKAYTWLNYISFFSAVGLLGLTVRPPNSPSLRRIIKITMWITISSTTSAFSCATSMVVAKSLDEVLIILAVPLVVVFSISYFIYC